MHTERPRVIKIVNQIKKGWEGHPKKYLQFYQLKIKIRAGIYIVKYISATVT